VQDVFLWLVTQEGQLKILAMDSEYENDFFVIKSLSSEELIILRIPENQPPVIKKSEMVLRRMSPPDRVVIHPSNE